MGESYEKRAKDLKQNKSYFNSLWLDSSDFQSKIHAAMYHDPTANCSQATLGAQYNARLQLFAMEIRSPLWSSAEQKQKFPKDELSKVKEVLKQANIGSYKPLVLQLGHDVDIFTFLEALGCYRDYQNRFVYPSYGEILFLEFWRGRMPLNNIRLVDQAYPVGDFS